MDSIKTKIETGKIIQLKPSKVSDEEMLEIRVKSSIIAFIKDDLYFSREDIIERDEGSVNDSTHYNLEITSEMYEELTTRFNGSTITMNSYIAQLIEKQLLDEVL